MKVLFISAWYPNRYDEMAGLFVRKHAQAVSQFCEVEVLYIHPSTDISRFEISTNKIANVKETTVYFPAKSNNIVQKLIKGLSNHAIKRNELFAFIIALTVNTKLFKMMLNGIKIIPFWG